MNAEMRILSRIIEETYKGIKSARWMNLIIITTMAAILGIFSSLFRTSLFITQFVNDLGNSMEVSIYLKPGIQASVFKDQILKNSAVKSIKIITKEEAWADLRKQMDLPNISNALPDTVRVRLKDIKEIESFIASAKKMSAVEDVLYAKKLAEQISTFGYYTNLAALIFIILLGGVTLFIINNTIHLLIESRKQEIDIMKMMGVSYSYIKAPFIFQGAFYGFWGAVLALIPLSILCFYLKKMSEFFYINYLFLNTNIVVLVTLLTGITVGAVGSLISVKRYLKV